MILLLCFVVAGGLALVTTGVVRGRQPVTDAADYLRSLDDDRPADQFEEVLSQSFVRRIVGPLSGSLLGSIGNMTPEAQRDKIRKQLLQAGLSAAIRAEDFLAIQAIATVVGVGLGVLYLVTAKSSPTTRLLIAVILGAAGYMLPQAWLSRKVTARKQAVFLDLPDVLDLMAISVEAGTGFESAMGIVCEHFVSPLAEEFSRTLKEMELGLPRREALQNLKLRTEVPELSNFVLVLIQADALGMPIGRVLHSQAVEMRMKRRQWAREKAAKLPVKILFPLVAFIFPPVLIVLMGPAASQILHAFHH